MRRRGRLSPRFLAPVFLPFRHTTTLQHYRPYSVTATVTRQQLMKQYQLTNVSSCDFLRSFGEGDTRWGVARRMRMRERLADTPRLGSASVLSRSPRR